MPNHVTNIVVVSAPFETLSLFLISGHRCVMHSDGEMTFNLHRLFSDDIPATDPTGCTCWSYDWMMAKTGVRANPTIEVTQADGLPCLSFTTAWLPCVELIMQLHRVTGWDIEYRFFDPMSTGGKLSCHDGIFQCDQEEEKGG
jgi:hypothetical protein